MRRNSPHLSSFILALFLAIGLLGPAPLTHAAGKPDINAATLEQLVTVTGIGEDTANNILAYKKEHGKFSSMEELETVNGVGKVRLEALREAFSVGSKKSGKKK